MNFKRCENESEKNSITNTFPCAVKTALTVSSSVAPSVWDLARKQTICAELQGRGLAENL